MQAQISLFKDKEWCPKYYVQAKISDACSSTNNTLLVNYSDDVSQQGSV